MSGRDVCGIQASIAVDNDIDVNDGIRGLKEVVVLVCAMGKKLARRPMQNLLSHLRAHHQLRVISIDEHTMDLDVELWPKANVLVPLVSNGFPLERAHKYATLRRAFVVNDLELAYTLRDRAATRSALRLHRLPVADGVIYRPDAGDRRVVRASGAQVLIYTRHGLLRGAVQAPYVEKPADADNHEVIIYYGPGRGSRRLHRKVGNRSSERISDDIPLRNSGAFVYEQFHEPDMCADVKVYAAGDYFYAEARKAPHIDGVVERDAAGLEKRTRVVLTPNELRICERVVSAFGQFMNGFDLLRTKDGRTFVIDVNGWSFVKRSNEWGPNSAEKLIEFILRTSGTRAAATKPRNNLSVRRRVHTENPFDVDVSPTAA